MNLLKPLIKAGKAAAKVEVKDKPFFSAVDKAALELARTKGTGKEFMTELRKVPGVKPAEIQHRKLERIEALPKMEKADFLKELEANPPIGMLETTKIERTPENLDELAKSYGYDDLYEDLSDDAMEYIDKQATNYDEYKFPGGSNYREILLQTPHFTSSEVEDLMGAEARYRRNPGNPLLAHDVEFLKKKQASYGEEYKSPHWEGDPNVLAHMRVQDRIGPNGEKILHVEELQSDWHQKGRKHGYYTPEQREDFKQAYKAWKLSDPKNQYGTTRQFIQEFPDYADIALNKVPEAPFKKNWHELAMKRLINYAAENGYDSIAITPGAEQAKRYDLSKRIDQIKYFKNPDGTYDMAVRPAGEARDTMHIGDKSLINLPESELESLVGKEIAQKIAAGEGPQGGDKYRSLSGIDLQVGGEGMQGFYDKMIPDYLNSFGKKYGSQVEMGGYKLTDPSGRSEAAMKLGVRPEQYASMAPEEREAFHAKLDDINAKQLHQFKITPEMREEVTSQGMPLYQKIGVPLGTGAAGAEMEVPQPVEQVEEPAYAAGGVVDNTTPDMSDGGQIIQGDAFKRGGKVKFTKNTDAMFMDVHDKKLAGGGLLKKALKAAKPAIKGMQEVLPLADREANLQKFLSPSKVQKRLYHGTNKDFNEFNLKKQSTGEGGSHSGSGFYFTEDPESASNYALMQGIEGANVKPVYLSIKNPLKFDWDKGETVGANINLTPKQVKEIIMSNPNIADIDESPLTNFGDIRGGNFNKVLNEAISNYANTSMLSALRNDFFPNDHESWLKALAKATGHDSAMTTTGTGENHYIAWSPEQIKSATGNRGTYDINEPEINKRKGGLANIKRK